MKYQKTVPEIMMDLGENTVFDNPHSVHQKIIHLHINLENWLGDDLLWNLPETIVTERLKNALEHEKYTGFTFDEIEVTKDVYFDDNYHLNKPFPKFYWMKVNGKEDIDDVFLKEYTLFMSDRFLKYLKINFSIDHLEINPTRNEFDDFIDKMISDSKKGTREENPEDNSINPGDDPDNPWLPTDWNKN
ncbi:hypothetical protein GCM10022289_31140 [Pedobacter jeongneungensis]|uniref:Uncharacterized protein n=1 Tax=Pedobacter jeongneungensis TaxID=947309 RepID=A0ABP8BIX8_9SPHI